MTSVLIALLLATPIATRPLSDETRAEQVERLTAIAEDVAAVTTSVEEQTLLLAVAEHESGFNRVVDYGPCPPGWCDDGRAACLLQIQATERERAKLFADRRACFTEGLRRLRASLSMCRTSSRQHRLAAYASGSCARGLRGSRELVAGWDRWRARYAREVAK